jgi:hypothetical protein
VIAPGLLIEHRCAHTHTHTHTHTALTVAVITYPLHTLGNKRWPPISGSNMWWPNFNAGVLSAHTTAFQLLYHHWSSLTCSLRSVFVCPREMLYWTREHWIHLHWWTASIQNNSFITSHLPGNSRMSSSCLPRPSAPGPGEAAFCYTPYFFTCCDLASE